MFVVVVFCIFLLKNVESHFYDTNITDLSKCTVHYARSGSVYKDFYDIKRTPNQDDALLLDFHFAVMAPSDAHILLAPSNSVTKNDPAYEIVIGAGGDTFCDIRRKQKSEVKASVRIKDLISALDPKSFWLHISKEGNIAVGKEGEELPFISWIDPDPLPIKVISFSTWSGIEAKWYFDCERQNRTKAIEKNLTYTEKLRRDMLYHYDPYVRPVQNISTITIISMALQISHVRLDEHDALLDILGETKMAWHDEKLKWDPSKYGSLESLHIFRREIWQPSLMLHNAVDDGRDILADSMMIAHSNGLVEWNPPINLKAWCDAETMGTWPSDVHKCSLMLAFYREFDNIRLAFKRNESSLIYFESSEWSVQMVDVYSGTTSSNDKFEPGIFRISLTLKRNSNMYKQIFFTPFLVLAVSVLATFWVDPMGSMKISLCCFQMILTTIILIVLSQYTAKHPTKVPNIVLLYSYSLAGELVATAISIIVINLSRNLQTHPLPHLLCNILTTKAVNAVICSSEMENNKKLKCLNEQQKMWILFGAAIDRLSFLVYLSLILYAICSY